MLVLTSRVILGSGSRRTHDHVFLFSFRYMLSIVYDTNRIEFSSSDSSALVVCVFFAAVWCLPTYCLATAVSSDPIISACYGEHTDMQTAR
jgi:hypothetical protein